MGHTIKLELHKGQWYARYSDPEIKTIMMTDLIPTPWLEPTPKEKVIREIQKRNPEYSVA